MQKEGLIQWSVPVQSTSILILSPQSHLNQAPWGCWVRLWSLWRDVKKKTPINWFCSLPVFLDMDSMEWDARPKHLSKMALLIFISCSQCIPFKIADSQKNFTGSLPQIYGFLDIVGYDNSKGDYDIFYSFNSTCSQKYPNEESFNMWYHVIFKNIFQYIIPSSWILNQQIKIN